jgi:peptide/nickel transport system permease protein
MPWLLRRVATALLLVWAVASIVFLAIRLVPGDPATLLLSQGGVAPDPGAVAALRQQIGLDQPIWVQYRDSIAGALAGDLGASLQDGAPVAGAILQRLPRTLEVIVAAALVALLLGVPVGLAAAVRRGGVLDRAAALLAGVALAMPVFVVGTLIVLVFAQWLRWVPAGGYVPFAEQPLRHLLLLARPAAAIAAGLAAIAFRMTRVAVLDVLRRDHVRTARAKGLAPARILLHHVLRNALLPIVGAFGLQLGALLGGTVLVEYVFNWPGLSGLLVDAVNARDYPVVQGVVLVISVLFVALNLLTDLLYAALDPRLRRS